jgi:peptide-methionine (S)-S-oxide reductase
MSSKHFVNDNSLTGPFPVDHEQILFGMGCFWGAERLFWLQKGVWTTAAAYAGGHSLNPDYRAVCSGLTGHAEVVLVVFDPAVLPFETLLKLFWEAHDPTQGMRQGNDIGSQYRSMILATNANQLQQAEASRTCYQAALEQRGKGRITTEISMAGPFYYAEEYHQQYLAKHPAGYCGLQGTGVPCPALDTATATHKP